jgi:hypothetical protein
MPKEFGPLADYTSCLALYHGEGTLTFANRGPDIFASQNPGFGASALSDRAERSR